MPFEPGHPKYGGRQKGTPSRKKMTVEKAADTFLRMGVNPIERLCKIAKSKKPVPIHQLEALKELCRYFAPRLSTQNITARVGADIEVAHRIMAVVAADPTLADAAERIAIAMAMETDTTPVIEVRAEPLQITGPRVQDSVEP
jgi:hypothetical protein